MIAVAVAPKALASAKTVNITSNKRVRTLEETEDPVHFLHLRYHPKTPDPKRPPANYYGTTLAFKAIQGVDSVTVVWSMSECGKRDNFCRNTGRVKSEGRLRSAQYSRNLIIPGNEVAIEDVEAYVVEAYYKLKERDRKWKNVRDVLYSN